MRLAMTSSSRALAVVGDIHGEADRLGRALDSLLTDANMHLVFTGDFVNRGAGSRRVLDLLLAARDEHPGGVTLVRGNHETVLLEFLRGGSLPSFVSHGGLATVRSYLDPIRSGAVDEFKNTFPPSHRRLLEDTVACYEDDGVLVSHVGFDPAQPGQRTFEALCIKGHPGLFRHDGPWPKPLTVCGHYVQNSRQPYDSPHFICLDTGCGTIPNAPLTVLTLPARTYTQF